MTTAATDAEESAAHPRFAEAHRTRSRVLADRSLLAHDVVWAAAGTPYTVSPVGPKELVGHAGATLVDVREPAA